MQHARPFNINANINDTSVQACMYCMLTVTVDPP